MDSELLQRVMALAEKTGDRVIVVNPESGAAHAVLPFDAYEELVNGGTASLRDLGQEAGAERDWDEICGLDEDEGDEAAARPVASASSPEEIGRVFVEERIKNKIAEESQKDAVGATPLDILDEEAEEEHYYLEPLE